MAPPLEGTGHVPMPLSYTNGNTPGKTNLPIGHDDIKNNEIRNGAVRSHPSSHFQSHSPRPRLLTVDEALQYSPFASIIPFDPQIIPVPSVAHTNSASLLNTSSIGEKARQQLSRIDAELQRHKGNSALAIEAFRDLKPLLDKEGLTRYQIKERGHSRKTYDGTQSSASNGSTRSVMDTLSPFARQIFDATDVAYEVGSSNAPAIATAKKLSQKAPPTTKPLHSIARPNSLTPSQSLPTPYVQGERIIQNHGAVANNADVSVVLESPPFSPSKQQPMVLVQPLPKQVPRSEYKPVQETKSHYGQRSPNAQAHSSVKDRKAAADEALERLLDAIAEISESDFSQPHSQIVRTLENGQEAFSDVGLTKLAPSLQKAANLGRVKDVKAEQLVNIQRLCENAIEQMESANLTISAGWSDDESSQWCQRAENALLALRSSRVALRIMEACPDQKQVHSEELVERVVRMIETLTRSCIIPVTESRSSDTSSSLFEAAGEQKKSLTQLMQNMSKTLNLTVALMGKVELPETIINAVESLATQLIFVENAHNEKDSVLGIQRFESLRRIAMDLISGIFSRYRDQRTAIVEDILNSLQKLPVSRQHARQFRLSDGSSIQLVSALLMRLIQTSATPCKDNMKTARLDPSDNLSPKKRKLNNSTVDIADGVVSSGKESNDEETPDEDGPKEPRVQWYMRRLAKKAGPLCIEASSMTLYIVRLFISRAITSPTKSGDQPYRHLLDIFCEDLLLVVGNPEWPASELLLRTFLLHMLDIAEKPQHLATTKAMALEILGQMGCAISDLVAYTRNLTKTAENTPKNMIGYLAPLFDDYMEGHISNNDLYDKAGIYNLVLDYMQTEGPEGGQLRNAYGYYLTFYAKAFASADIDVDLISLKYLREINDALSGSDWLVYNWGDALPVHRRLAYALTVLHMEFFRQFDRIMKVLLDSIISDQVAVRNKSLRSVTIMLEKEPSLLDRAKNVRTLIMRCAQDSSPSVRDSALMLMGKCISLRPSMEQDFRRAILILSGDGAVSVRKRSIKLLKELFSRRPSNDVQAAISAAVLNRTKDDEKSVFELARQTFEEMWLSPFWPIIENQEKKVSDKFILIHQVDIMVQTVKQGDQSAQLVTEMLSNSLSSRNKQSQINFRTCRAFVATAVDILLDAESVPHKIDRKDILPLLMVLAKSNARLFTADQLQYLQPYIANLSTTDDTSVFRCAVIIFRTVLSTLSNVRKGFLTEIQGALIQTVLKLSAANLSEVAACLWSIDAILHNTEKLVKLSASAIKHLQDVAKLDMADLAQQANLAKAKKCIKIAGSFGQHCDFEKQKTGFQGAVRDRQVSTVAGLFVNSILPFTKVDLPLSLRADAYQALGAICQRWPYQFSQNDVSKTFQEVLSSGAAVLQEVVLTGFRDLVKAQDIQFEVKPEEQALAPKDHINGKLGASMTASDGESASSLIAQNFLNDISGIALTSDDATALIATEVITCISGRGFVYPKQSASTLVALETSTNPKIADIAYKTHLKDHQQHESAYEREYTRAISEAFSYQKDIVKDPLGYTLNPLTSKLHLLFDVISTSSAKYQQKFVSNLCSRIDFDLSQINVSESIPSHLNFARFLIENLAFSDYRRIDTLQHVVACMEKVVTGTGSSLSHTISMELSSFITQGSQPGAEVPNHPPQITRPDSHPDPIRLRQIVTGTIILSCLWDARTYLRRLYGLDSLQKRAGKGRPTTKDLSATPTKIAGISGERLIAAVSERLGSLGSQEAMFAQCRDFVELMSVDSEVKVAEEGEDQFEETGTPSGDEAEPTMPASGGSRRAKRKGSESVNGTPAKKRGRPSLGSRKKSAKRDEDDSD